MALFAVSDREEALDIVQDSMLRLVDRYLHRCRMGFCTHLQNRNFDVWQEGISERIVEMDHL